MMSTCLQKKIAWKNPGSGAFEKGGGVLNRAFLEIANIHENQAMSVGDCSLPWAAMFINKK